MYSLNHIFSQRLSEFLEDGLSISQICKIISMKIAEKSGQLGHFKSGALGELLIFYFRLDKNCIKNSEKTEQIHKRKKPT
jgi:hypothetical protein